MNRIQAISQALVNERRQQAATSRHEPRIEPARQPTPGNEPPLNPLKSRLGARFGSGTAANDD